MPIRYAITSCPAALNAPKVTPKRAELNTTRAQRKTASADQAHGGGVQSQQSGPAEHAGRRANTPNRELSRAPRHRQAPKTGPESGEAIADSEENSVSYGACGE